MEKIWLKSYPKGIPAEINPDLFSSLVDIFEQTCEQFKKHPAFYNMGVTLNFNEMDYYTRAFAAYLQQGLNLKKGDRIAIMLPNILQYPVVMFGALRAGLTVVNVNPLYTAPELIHQLKDSGAETIVVLANFLETVQKALSDTPIKTVIVTQLGDLFPPIKALIINSYLKYIKKAIPQNNLKNALSFKNILQQGKKFHFKRLTIHPTDIAFLQYTGGTTGLSKGAMLTHRNLVANVLQAEAWFSPLLELGKEIIITALPLYHIFSLTANCLFIFKTGGLNVLITNPRDVPDMIKEMGKFKFTAITGVNTLFSALLKNSNFSNLDFTTMKMSLGGGMPVQRAIAEQWKSITEKPLLEAYGLTETSPCVAANPITSDSYNGTVGLPIPSTDVCIVDDAGRALPLGEKGELAIKGPQVMYGYWHNPQETQKVFTKEGWLLTGDIASITEEGFIYLHERKKDMILVSGFNVYPSEIEDVLVRLKGVREAAVIGVPEDSSGEAVKAFIVKDEPDLTISDVLRYCHKNLTGYKIPKYVEFRPDLPKSNVGKILRRALRESEDKITEN